MEGIEKVRELVNSFVEVGESDLEGLCVGDLEGLCVGDSEGLCVGDLEGLCVGD